MSHWYKVSAQSANPVRWLITISWSFDVQQSLFLIWFSSRDKWRSPFTYNSLSLSTSRFPHFSSAPALLHRSLLPSRWNARRVLKKKNEETKKKPKTEIKGRRRSFVRVLGVWDKRTVVITVRIAPSGEFFASGFRRCPSGSSPRLISLLPS